jgi:hypothetical protein
MKRLLSVLAVVLSLSFSAAQAHTHLESSMPADGAVLTSAPKEVMLHFSEATRLTALTIQKDGDKDAKSIATLPKDPTAAATVPLDVLGPGKYTVSWRALGDDSHVMNGKLSFTVKGK